MHKKDAPWVFIFLGFALLDIFLTAFALDRGGSELNPVGRFLWESSGIMGLVSGKILLALLVALLWETNENQGRRALCFCAIVQIGVVTLTSVVYLYGIYFQG